MSRKRLPDTRDSITHHFRIDDGVEEHDGYITVGLYEDGRPGELFVTMSKAPPGFGALLDQLSTAISFGLQNGIPLETFCDKFIGTRYEPAGSTGNKNIPRVCSPSDYIFKYLKSRFCE